MGVEGILWPVSPQPPHKAQLSFHHDAFVFDGHNDMLLRHLAGEDVTATREYGHLDLPRMREGGFDGGIFAVWIDPGHADPEPHTLEGLARSREFLEKTPGFRLVLEAEDLEAARLDGDVAVVLGVEGGYSIDQNLDTVDRLYDEGMRCLTLTWMAPTAWADAAGPSGAEETHGGLTNFGRRVVDRLQTLGCVIDLSHSSDSVARQVLEQVDVPVTVSHSGCRSVASHPRNLPDDLIEALAAGAGVLGINLFSAYLDEAYAAAHAALEGRVSPEERDSFRRMAELCSQHLDPVSLSRFCDHVRHAVRVAGSEHVGLGSDFDGAPALPREIRDARDLPLITAALMDRGFDAAGLTSFLGANFQRLLGAVLT